MDTSMSFNPELGFYAWLDTVAYILDCEMSDVKKNEAAWRSQFDAGKTPTDAIRAEARAAALEEVLATVKHVSGRSDLSTEAKFDSLQVVIESALREVKA